MVIGFVKKTLGVRCCCSLLLSVGMTRAAPLRGVTGLSSEAKTQDLRNTLSWLESEFGQALGSAYGERVDERLSVREVEFAPMFAALPKNEWGRLRDVGVGYALHRYFVHRHGIYLKGLEPDHKLWSAASPSAILETRVPAYLQGLVEERLGGHGFGVHELAVLSLVLEHVIRDESKGRLETAFRLHGLNTSEGSVSPELMEKAIDTYVILLLSSVNAAKMNLATADHVYRAEQFLKQVDPALLSQMLRMSRDVQAQLLEKDAARATPFDFAIRAVDGIDDRFGRIQDLSCLTVKKTLGSVGDSNTGRVPFAAFQKMNRSASWSFEETQEMLTLHGILDESDPQTPMVIIPNYVNLRSNCLGTSGLYSICCISECEDILGAIERKIQAPEAEPAELIEAMGNVPSATVRAPRELEESIAMRLDEIAGHRDGKVPLHGRFFAQVLHYAYPMECSYPRTPVKPYKVLLGNVLKPEKVLLGGKRRATKGAGERGEKLAKWFSEEELFAGRHARSTYAQVLGWVLGWVLKIMVLAAMVFSMRAILRSGINSTSPPPVKKLVVSSKYPIFSKTKSHVI